MTASEEELAGIRRWEQRRPTSARQRISFLTSLFYSFFGICQQLFGKRLYALNFLFLFGLFFSSSRHLGHLIIFLFCNIPREKSRLFPWETVKKGDWLSGVFLARAALLAFLSYYSFPFVGSLFSARGTCNEALLHEILPRHFSQWSVWLVQPPSLWHVDLKLPEETMGREKRRQGGSLHAAHVEHGRSCC